MKGKGKVSVTLDLDLLSKLAKLAPQYRSFSDCVNEHLKRALE